MTSDSRNTNPRENDSRGKETRSDLKGKGSYPQEVHREFPQAPDSEKGVLASILLAPEDVLDLCGEKGVTRAAFYLPAHAEIFQSLHEIRESRRPLDFITIAQYLRDRNKLDGIGGAAYLNELFVFLPSAANVQAYIDDLLSKHVLRQIIEVCTEFAKRSYEEQDQPQILLDEVEKKIFEIAKDRFKDKTPAMKDMVMRAIADIQKLYDSRGKITGLETGFKALDQMTDGLHGAEMIVIAARPSMGKTALAMNIAEHIAVEVGQPVAVFSLEMSAQQLVQRLLCSLARVNLGSIRNGFLSERDFPALMAAAERLAKSKILIDDTSSIEILALRAKARRMKAKDNIAAIFIDYLQLIRSPGKRNSENRQLEIADISANLKALAKELNIPIVVLAQLNRNPEQRTGDSKGRPRLSDLRESGSIEQDADLVGLLVREEYYAENDEAREESKGKATLIIAKQRNGPVGDVPLTFLKEFTRFEDRAEGPEPEI
jgi:replicative DNA helicase